MQATGHSARFLLTGRASILVRITAALLLFEFVSGLAITFGPFHPAVEWGLLVHTGMGLATLPPIARYFARHWEDYARQTMSGALLIGYVGLAAQSCVAI